MNCPYCEGRNTLDIDYIEPFGEFEFGTETWECLDCEREWDVSI